MRESQNNPALKRALGGLVNALDGAMERSTSGALAGEWKDARQQYQALSTVNKVMQGGTAESRAAGDIPFGAFTNAVRAGDKLGYPQGRGQYNELSRIGDYLAQKVPNSGTAERMGWQDILKTGGLSSGGAVTGALLGGPIGAAAGTLVGAAAKLGAPYVTSAFYNSPAGKAYLTNQLLNPINLKGVLGGQGIAQASQIPAETNYESLSRALLQLDAGRKGLSGR
jgi:hypothetical protein